ncbi:short transient receptor potential channel 5-like isoform X2 [Patiria miniata]|uniref:Ion transport domain-containing protein n=1 Tax=Patiria miniata TaxID=46514 RepID=A0A913YZK0_PATMI|nr:short transient receptor potential channel 5-like isoform X2 [Patiria miniata]
MAEDQIDGHFLSTKKLTIPDVSPTKSITPSCDSRFLKFVKENDISGVRRLFAEGEINDLTECDELGRSALTIAIDCDYLEMLQCLLESDLDPGDALYYAIETHSIQGVQTLCRQLKETRREDILNRFPVTPSWPSTCKPLILAARQDNYHIVKVPRFKQGCDRIEANLAALSTKLLSLARDNKEVALLLNGGDDEEAGKPRLPRRLRQAFDIDFKEFVSHPSSQDYMISQWRVPSLHFLRRAMSSEILCDLIYLLFMLLFPVTCILYIILPVEELRIFQRPLVRFLLHLASKLYFLLLLILSTMRPRVLVVSSGQSMSENLTADQRIRLYMNYKARPWDVFTILIIMWIVGMTYRAVKEVWHHSLKRYLINNKWNILDLLQLVLYWTFIIMSVVSYVQAWQTTQTWGLANDVTDIPETRNERQVPSTPIPTQPDEQQFLVNMPQTTGFPPDAADSFEDFDPQVFHQEGGPPDRASIRDDVILGNYENESRYDWHVFDPLLVAESAFALANVLTYLHLVHSLVILESLGPLLISYKSMVADVTKVAVIFIFLVISFSLGLTQLYRTFERLDLQTCMSINDKSECPDMPFLSFSTSMESLLWSLFNLIDQSNLAVDEDLYLTEYVGKLMYLTFMVVAVLVLLNALIAMMSNTYTRVEDNSEVEWKFARAKLMAEYMTPSVTLPPPFNLVPSCKSILRVICCLYRKCCNRQLDRGHRTSNDNNGTYELETKKPSYSGIYTDYQVLSRALAERCHRASQMEKVKQKHKSKAKQEMAALKKTVENISDEMRQLQLQMQKFMYSK